MTLPFLKWPGGKRWISSLIAEIVEAHLGENGIYFEPFLGGAAVFFGVEPERAFLSDVNQSLINAYEIVKSDPQGLISRIRSLPVSKAEYNRLRSARPQSPVSQAAQFLFLNRTAFGGIYRLNREGNFNVPYGGGERKPDGLWSQGLVMAASEILESADLECCDFSVAMAHARRGDVVYCDPTYTVTHNNNCFTRYNEKNFSWADQQRLVEAAEQAAQRGATVIVSNADHPSLLALYKGWVALSFARPSCVTPLGLKRRETSENLFLLNAHPGILKTISRP